MKAVHAPHVNIRRIGRNQSHGFTCPVSRLDFHRDRRSISARRLLVARGLVARPVGRQAFRIRLARA